MSFASRTGTGTGGGQAFNPQYSATILTLTVGPSPVSVLDITAPVLASIVSDPNALVGAPANPAAPLLTNDTTVKSAAAAAVMNSLRDRLTLDLAQSEALSKSTGKEWLFYTL